MDDFIQKKIAEFRKRNVEHQDVEARIAEKIASKRLYNIHKRSIPPGIDRIVVYNCESREAAERLIEHATDSRGNKVFATRLYFDEPNEIKTYVFYDLVPADATPKERSVYFNPLQIVKDDIPRRVN